MIAGPSIQAAASVTATFDATPVTAILSTAPVTAILGATQMAALLGATPLVAVVRAVAVVVEAVVAVVGVVVAVVGGVGAVVAGGVLVVLRVRFVAVTVRGRSMEPTLWHGDRVLVRRSSLGGVRPGRLVVVAAEPGASWLVKRVVAVPGDPVPRAEVPALANRPERVVPPGQLVVLGDNRPISFDSRRFGYVPARQLLGVVVGHLPKTPRRRPAGR
ncbi:S26 family signal peptidase [Nonomuraea sp. NPDC049684]|uniref:S26 family signal peptidase n=1 Tax=Nonomuraea sp. NPDC049684 TaxID=3364356 RepID=UPI0037955935